MGRVTELDDAYDQLAVRSSGLGLGPDQQSLWKDAIEKYKEDFSDDLSSKKDNFARRLRNATSYEGLLDIVQDTGKKIERFRNGSKAWRAIRDALKPVVRIVLMFNDAVADGVSMPGGNAIFAAIGILLRAAQNQSQRLDNVAQLFEELSQLLMRLDARKGAPYNTGSRAIAVEILVQLLNVMSIATKLVRKNRFELFVEALVKEDKIQEVFRKLEKLTDHELGMTAVEVLSTAHRIETKVDTAQEAQTEMKSTVESAAEKSTAVILTAIDRLARTQSRERSATRGDVQAVVSICRRLEASAAFQPSPVPRPSPGSSLSSFLPHASYR